MAARPTIDRDRLRELWLMGLTRAKIAEMLGGVSAGSVSRISQELGLPPRPQGRIAASVLDAVNPDFTEPPAARVRAVPVAEVVEPQGHPFFRARHDAEILQSAGRYRDLVALADKWGQPIRRVQQRWHQLRAGA